MTGTAKRTMTQRILETVKMKILRITSNTLRARSEDGRKICKVDNINEWIRGKKIKQSYRHSGKKTRHLTEEDQQKTKKEVMW
jgi:hypothetical protein